LADGYWLVASGAPDITSVVCLFVFVLPPTGRMLQLHQSAGAAQRRDALRLWHQRLQPHLPQLQGEGPGSRHVSGFL